MTASERLHDAMRPRTDQPWNESQEAIDRTHLALAELLGELCPSARVQLTGFFNHSFIPDAFLHYDQDTKRGVHLRFDAGTEPLFAEYSITYTGSDGPVFVCLHGLDAERPDYDPAAVKYADRCLVIPAGGLNALRGGADTDQVLRHGAGFLNASLARRVSAGEPGALAELIAEPRERDVQLTLI